jgi:hypothetical protein
MATALWHVHRKAEAFPCDGYNFHKESATVAPATTGLQKDGKTFILDPAAKHIENPTKSHERKAIKGRNGAVSHTEKQGDNAKAGSGRPDAHRPGRLKTKEGRRGQKARGK